jgi:predicted amidophosphoribosyltransferase
LPGLTGGPEQALLCPACQDGTYAFDRARSYAVYEGAVVRAILLLKFEQIEPLGMWFAERLAEVVDAEGANLAADVVVPVPLHRQRERERGYNQAALVSKPLAKKLRLPHKSGAPDAHAATSRQAGAEFGGTMGVRSWCFCHTSRQPS